MVSCSVQNLCRCFAVSFDFKLYFSQTVLIFFYRLTQNLSCSHIKNSCWESSWKSLFSFSTEMRKRLVIHCQKVNVALLVSVLSAASCYIHHFSATIKLYHVSSFGLKVQWHNFWLKSVKISEVLIHWKQIIIDYLPSAFR